MEITFEKGNFPLPLISEKTAGQLDIESGDLVLLKRNDLPLHIISVAIGDHTGEKLLLPDHMLLEPDHRAGVLHIEKFISAPRVPKVEVEIIDHDHQGVLVENIRKNITGIRYFVSRQTTIIQPDNRKMKIRISCDEHSVFSVDQTTRICIRGERIPSIDDIGGQQELIDWYHKHYLFALTAKDYLQKWHIPSPRGLLLSGKPGLGKTHFLKAMVADSGVYHISIFAPNIITPLAGDGDMVIMDTFEKARKNSPAIISIDEIDALCLKRSDRNQNYENRVVTVLLQEMDGVLSRGDVFVIGATNRPEAIDEAFLRPGRLSRHIALQLPQASERLSILKIHLKQTDYDLSEKDFNELASKTDGYTPAQIAGVVHQAALIRIKKHLDFQEKMIITKEDLLENIPL